MIANILSIHGMSGLYKIISRNRNCIIVEGLSDKKRTSIPLEKKMISLGDIAIYTEDGEMPLRNVFSSIKERIFPPFINHSVFSSKEMPQFPCSKAFVNNSINAV